MGSARIGSNRHGDANALSIAVGLPCQPPLREVYITRISLNQQLYVEIKWRPMPGLGARPHKTQIRSLTKDSGRRNECNSRMRQRRSMAARHRPRATGSSLQAAAIERARSTATLQGRDVP